MLSGKRVFIVGWNIKIAITSAHRLVIKSVWVRFILVGNIDLLTGLVAQTGRAPASQAGGPGFKSRRVHLLKPQQLYGHYRKSGIMRATVFLLLLISLSGCTIRSTRENIRLESEIVPSKMGLDEPVELKLEARVKNVGTSNEVITADVVRTEGLIVTKPDRTTFTLKPGESRTITFSANLTEDAVPGDYIIDVQVKTQNGNLVWDRAKLRVVERKGLLSIK